MATKGIIKSRKYKNGYQRGYQKPQIQEWLLKGIKSRKYKNGYQRGSKAVNTRMAYCTI